MPDHKTIPILLGWMLLIGLVFPVRPLGAEPVEIKVAVVTPEGSAWVKVLKQMVADIESRTKGEATFTIYAGGVSGDEADVLRKMRINRIQAAGFSGVGLGNILPRVRVLEAPLLFADNREIDRVREALFDEFAADFKKQGYILLGFAEGGWVYLFSRQNLATDEGFKSARMWVWEGDRVAETLLDAFGVRTTPLNIADVNTGLETGMIDSFYAPPLAAVAFQWSTRVDYMLDYPVANSTGGLLMTRRAFARLSPAHQQTVRDLAREYCRKLVDLTRKDNQAALKVLQRQGVEFVTPSERQKEIFHENARETYTQSIPQLYPKALFERIRTVLEEHRAATQ